MTDKRTELMEKRKKRKEEIDKIRAERKQRREEIKIEKIKKEEKLEEIAKELNEKWGNDFFKDFEVFEEAETKEKNKYLTEEEFQNIIDNMTEEQKIMFKKKRNILWDFVEDTEEYRQAMKKLQPILDEEFPANSYTMGTCHRYWARKQELLKKCGINWKTPSQMNPFTKFD